MKDYYLFMKDGTHKPLRAKSDAEAVEAAKRTKDCVRVVAAKQSKELWKRGGDEQTDA